MNDRQRPLEVPWERWFGPGLVVLILALWVTTRWVGNPVASAPEMPSKVTAEAERELYLTPNGRYTSTDIEANGGRTASQQYQGFQARHDLHPQPGDKLCPITRTKASPDCSWIVDGHRYEFCCPPCIDEFVRLAKEQPDQLQKPTEFVAR